MEVWFDSSVKVILLKFSFWDYNSSIHSKLKTNHSNKFGIYISHMSIYQSKIVISHSLWYYTHQWYNKNPYNRSYTSFFVYCTYTRIRKTWSYTLVKFFGHFVYQMYTKSYTKVKQKIHTDSHTKLKLKCKNFRGTSILFLY